MFVNWCQEFVGDCIISCDKECLSDLTDEDWKELGRLEKEQELKNRNRFTPEKVMADRDIQRIFMQNGNDVSMFLTQLQL